MKLIIEEEENNDRHSHSSLSSSAHQPQRTQQELISELLKDDDVTRMENGIGYIFNPYNPLNIEIKESDIRQILTAYGIPEEKLVIHNIDLYRRAFIHTSYLKRPSVENVAMNIKIEECPADCMKLKTKSYERLEFLGDGVLELITKYYLYRRFPKEEAGFMTDKKIAIVNNENIGHICLEMGLHKWLVISKHLEEKGNRTKNLDILGDVFEAFLGALFLDMNKISVKDEAKWFETLFVTGPGIQMAQIFLENIFERHIDWTELIQTNNNFKNKLQEKIQKEFKVTPHYLETNYDKDTGYTMGVYICLGQPIHGVHFSDAINVSASSPTFPNFQAIIDYVATNKKIFVLLGLGQHKKKKKAEQQACSEALKFVTG